MNSRNTGVEDNSARERFFGLLWSLCRRPGMYTLSGSVEEIWSFIHGAEAVLFGTPASSDASPLDGFAAWLSRRFEPNAPPFDLWFMHIQHHWARFGEMDKETIWSLFSEYYRETYGTEYQPLQLVPSCGYADDGSSSGQ